MEICKIWQFGAIWFEQWFQGQPEFMKYWLKLFAQQIANCLAMSRNITCYKKSMKQVPRPCCFAYICLNSLELQKVSGIALSWCSLNTFIFVYCLVSPVKMWNNCFMQWHIVATVAFSGIQFWNLQTFQNLFECLLFVWSPLCKYPPFAPRKERHVTCNDSTEIFTVKVFLNK